MTIALKHWESYKVKPDTKVRLGRIPADGMRFCDDKEAARRQLKKYRKEIDELLAVLAEEGKRSLLVILQGMDASGKDGAVRKVFTGVNPQYCKAVSFKEPDREEMAHDYLWRVYRALPAKGELGIFNRSQYEDVLARQAREEISRKEGLVRLRQIADVERTWTENGIVIRKFFLHISRKEQTSRLKARLESAIKHWKVQESDFRDRKHWAKFIAAYEEVFARTSQPVAPWFIIPADHKWYRDVAVAGIVLGALRSMRPRAPSPKIHRSRLGI